MNVKIRTPFYLLFSLLLSAYVAVANHNGWSPLRSLFSPTSQRGYPGTQHK